MNWREMLPDLPAWMWLVLAAPLVVMLGLMILLYYFAFRVQIRMDAERRAIFEAYFAARGWRCSGEDADSRRVEAALADLGGGSFGIPWVAAVQAGTFFEYWTGMDDDKHGFGYLERSPLAGLDRTLKIYPRMKLAIGLEPVFKSGREVEGGWASPEFHRRFGVVAGDAAVASRVVTSRLQSLLLELPEKSRLDKELIELAVNKNDLVVLGRKWDPRAKRGGPLPDLENHLRLALRIRDALGR